MFLLSEKKKPNTPKITHSDAIRDIKFNMKSFLPENARKYNMQEKGKKERKKTERN